MLRKLEQVRSKLNVLIEEGTNYEKILEVSEELDKLILEYMSKKDNQDIKM